MSNPSDKREFNRFPIDFVLEISTKDIEGREFIDNAVLKDISGGGAKFLTQKPEKYFLGQSLDIYINMPGTGDVSAKMKTSATIVRIDQVDQSKSEPKNTEITVSIKYNTHLNFERNEI